MTLCVEALDAEAMRWPDFAEMAVLKRVREVITLVVRTVVTIPVVVVDMRDAVDVAVILPFGLRRGVHRPLWRRFRNAAVICTWGIRFALRMLLTALREGRCSGQQQKSCQWCKASSH